MFFASSSIARIQDSPLEPVTLEEAKEYLEIRAGSTRYDRLLSTFIRAARVRCESSFRAGMSFLDTRWRYTGRVDDGVRSIGLGAAIDLPFGPIRSVEIVEYDTGTGATSVDLAGFVASIGQGGGIRFLKSYPLAYSPGFVPSVSVEYTAGYGTDPASVPEPAKLAILMMVANFFEYRSTDQPVPKNVAYLLESIGF